MSSVNHDRNGTGPPIASDAGYTGSALFGGYIFDSDVVLFVI